MPTVMRKAASHDARQIARVHVVAWQTAYKGIVPQPFLDSLDVDARAKDWNTWLQDTEAHVYVAEIDDQVCGFISGGKLREPILDSTGKPIREYDAELYAIYLLPSAKGQGLGKLLTRQLAEALDAQGFRRMAVWVLAENPSLFFYEHLGAQQISKKQVRISDADLLEVAYGWQNMQTLATSA